MDCSTPGILVHHQLQSLLKLMSIESVMPSNHLTLRHPLLLPPSIFSSIWVFSHESVLHIRWAQYWSFGFSISPSSEYSGLISFRMDWFDILAVPWTLYGCSSLLKYLKFNFSYNLKKKKKSGNLENIILFLALLLVDM